MSLSLVLLLIGGAVAQTVLPDGDGRGTRAPTALPAGTSWTAWLDRDDAGSSPTGGDYEQYTGFSNGFILCPVGTLNDHAECRRKAPFADPLDTNITCNANGLLCLNSDNQGGCSDWKVRFRCAPLVSTAAPSATPTAAPTSPTQSPTAAPSWSPIPVGGSCGSSSACATSDNSNYEAFGDLCDVFRSEPGGTCPNCSWLPRLWEDGTAVAHEWIQAAFSDQFVVTGFTLNATGVSSIELLSGDGGSVVVQDVNVDDNSPLSQVQRHAVNMWTTTSVRVRVSPSNNDPYVACGDIVVYAIQFYGHLAPASPTQPPITSRPTPAPTTTSPTVMPECASCAAETDSVAMNCTAHVDAGSLDCGTIDGWYACGQTCCEASCNTPNPPPTTPRPTASVQSQPPTTSSPPTAAPIDSGIVASAVPTTTAPAAAATDPPPDTSIDDGADDGGSDNMLIIVAIVLALLLCLLVVALVRPRSSSAKYNDDLPAERNTTPMVHNAVYAAPPPLSAHVPVVYKVHVPKRNLDGQAYVANTPDNGSPQYGSLGVSQPASDSGAVYQVLDRSNEAGAEGEQPEYGSLNTVHCQGGPGSAPPPSAEYARLDDARA